MPCAIVGGSCTRPLRVFWRMSFCMASLLPLWGAGAEVEASGVRSARAGCAARAIVLLCNCALHTVISCKKM